MTDIQPALTLDAVAQRIIEVRGQRVMLDADLAVLYGVETRYIPRAVKRNPGRFPHDFAFQLSTEEWESLRSQFVTSSLRSTFGISNGRGGRRYAPYVFTEHGALMLSSVLNSTRADEISLLIVRTFVWLRRAAPAYKELADKVAELENAVGKHDDAIKAIVQALQQMIVPPDGTQRRIGF